MRPQPTITDTVVGQPTATTAPSEYTTAPSEYTGENYLDSLEVMVDIKLEPVTPESDILVEASGRTLLSK